MGVIFNNKTGEFHLQNKNISYIFKILKNGQLGQLYFGKRISHRNSFEHLIDLPDNQPPYTATCAGDPHFSLDLLKQEYPAYGTTDFRRPGYQILQENGSRITNFVYKGHEIYNGKPKLEGLPATYVEQGDEATTLEVNLVDELIDAKICLFYTIYEDRNVITRSVKFFNSGSEKIKLDRVMSACLDFSDSNYEMVQLSGGYARERYVAKRKLQQGVQYVESTRGASSAAQNPFMALKRPETTETSGEVYGFSLVYSGNFLAQVEVDHYDVARVTMGINPFDFQWMLESGESFQTPEVVIVYSDKGMGGMSRTFHELYQNRLARGEWRNKPRPVLINNWEATYFDFNEDKILDIAKTASGLGIELFVLDDGWFGKRDDDTTSLGDWFVNNEKLPNGLKGLASKINELGMQFGLWFEPEMISKESNLYESHPDWLIKVPGREDSPSRNQHVLDFSRKDVKEYIYERLSAILSENPISYVKWDMNRNMTEIWSAKLPAERQQETAHRYMLGLYEIMEKLTTEFPHVLFESCAGGGGRFDPGMLYYMPQTWTSDNTDAVERLKIQYGTSMVYPLSSIGAHVSAVPNHQVGRITSVDIRGKVAYFGAFGYELDLNQMTTEEREKVKKQVEFYKENRELLLFGNFYRLKSPFVGDGNAAWMVVSKDKKEALVGDYRVLAKANESYYNRLKLEGLLEQTEYVENTSGMTFNGDELMNVGINLNLVERDYSNELRGDFQAKLFRLKAKN